MDILLRYAFNYKVLITFKLKSCWFILKHKNAVYKAFMNSYLKLDRHLVCHELLLKMVVLETFSSLWENYAVYILRSTFQSDRRMLFSEHTRHGRVHSILRWHERAAPTISISYRSAMKVAVEEKERHRNSVQGWVISHYYRKRLTVEIDVLNIHSLSVVVILSTLCFVLYKSLLDS